MARTDVVLGSSNNTVENQFDRLGHPGKYTAVLKHTGGVTDFTGSNYGYGAMMIGSGSSTTFGAADNVALTGGGSILLRDFASIHGTAGNEIRTSILELSVSKITTTAGAPDVYFLKRQQ
tara:strand:+ start:216 stop:575 length:360 start_codon:yes stop_codon:yes gene_type:complete